MGSGYPTVTHIVTQVSTDYLTETETESVTIFQTVAQTQHETDIQTAAQTVVQTATQTQKVTDIQTIIESTTVLQTLISTTTNSAGQAITQTFTVSSVSVVATAGGSADGVSGSGKSDDTRAIVGGVVGGLALLAILGLLSFAGLRRGWFDRRGVGPAPNRPPMSLHWATERSNGAARGRRNQSETPDRNFSFRVVYSNLNIVKGYSSYLSISLYTPTLKQLSSDTQSAPVFQSCTSISAQLPLQQCQGSPQTLSSLSLSR